jgi:hypothetical protein
MPRVNTEKFFEKMEYELKMSLKSALQIISPDNSLDIQLLFKEFKKQIRKNMKQWEIVDSATVDAD